MESFPDLTTEAKCREFLDRYPDNLLERKGHAMQA